MGTRGNARGRTAATAITSVVAVLATALLVALPAGTASADPDLRQARAAADELRDKVDRLHAAAEAAAEDYGDANDELDQVVAQLINSDEDLDAANLDARVADGRTADAARQMYMSGGPSALYASVLTGEDICDVLDRIASVDSVVRGSIVAGSDARERAAAAKVTTQDLALLTAQRRALEDRKVAAAEKAAAYLSEASTALEEANGLVRRLVEEERARAQAAAEAAARAAALDAALDHEPGPEGLARRDRPRYRRGERRPDHAVRRGRAHGRPPLAGYAVLRGRRRPQRPRHRLVLLARARRRPHRRRQLPRREHRGLRLLVVHAARLQPGGRRPAAHLAPAVAHRHAGGAQGPEARRPAVLGVQHGQPGVDPPRGALPRPRPHGALAAHRRPRPRGVGLPPRLHRRRPPGPRHRSRNGTAPGATRRVHSRACSA